MLITRLASLLLLFSLGSLSFGAFAGSGGMKFVLTEDCHSGRCQAVGLGVGEITTKTSDDLLVFLARNPKVKRILLHSPGGNLGGGLDLGWTLRSKGLDTVIGSKMRCLSACAYAFLGGGRREVRRGGVVGVHRFSSKSDALAYSEHEVQVLVEGMTRYVEGMGVSPRLISAASRAGRDEMILLSHSDARALRLDNTKLVLADWTLRPVNDSLVASAIAQDIGSDRTVLIFVSDEAKEILVVFTVQYPTLRPRISQEPFTLSLCVADNCIESSKPLSRSWEDEDYLTTSFQFNRDVFYRFLDREATTGRNIAFLVHNRSEATAIASDAKTFMGLIGRTGPSRR